MMPSTDMIAAAHTSSAAAAIAPGCQFPSASCRRRADVKIKTKSNQIKSRKRRRERRDARRRRAAEAEGGAVGWRWDAASTVSSAVTRSEQTARPASARETRAPARGSALKARRSEPSKATPASSSHLRAPAAIHAGAGGAAAALPPMRARDWFSPACGGRRVDGFD